VCLLMTFDHAQTSRSLSLRPPRCPPPFFRLRPSSEPAIPANNFHEVTGSNPITVYLVISFFLSTRDLSSSSEVNGFPFPFPPSYPFCFSRTWKVTPFHRFGKGVSVFFLFWLFPFGCCWIVLTFMNVLLSFRPEEPCPSPLSSCRGIRKTFDVVHFFFLALVHTPCPTPPFWKKPSISSFFTSAALSLLFSILSSEFWCITSFIHPCLAQNLSMSRPARMFSTPERKHNPFVDVSGPVHLPIQWESLSYNGRGISVPLLPHVYDS